MQVQGQVARLPKARLLVKVINQETRMALEGIASADSSDCVGEGA